MDVIDQLRAYVPVNEQEARDRELILQYIRENKDVFTRNNRVAHMTASAWVTNQEHTKVLMVYHNIYNSWSWCGGHADGDRDLLRVAMKECMEETGVTGVKPLLETPVSVECLTVDGHEKRGEYVSSHLHLNVTYLLEADDRQTLQVCEGENSRVGWFTPEEALKASTEPWFVERIYAKLNRRLGELA